MQHGYVVKRPALYFKPEEIEEVRQICEMRQLQNETTTLTYLLLLGLQEERANLNKRKQNES